MGSQQRFIERMLRNKRGKAIRSRCDVKAAYKDQASARAAAQRINTGGKVGHGAMRAYECDACGRWHLTSKEYSA